MVAITFDPIPVAGPVKVGPPVDDLRYEGPRILAVPAIEPGRRAAVLLAAVAAVIVAAAFAYLAMSPELTETGTVPVAEVGYTAVAGDSMWSIAQDRGPAGAIGPYVERLVAVNGTSTVVAGQHIVLPRT